MHSEHELLEGIQLIMPMEFLEEFRQQIKTKDEIEAEYLNPDTPKGKIEMHSFECLFLSISC
ncbi:hypothetical protein SAMN05421866_0557 [Chryseobacterium oranimense]|uniref:Uncharacterized protein n=1 Tax=Chryseobacterium oranimense TaxID=421058 RepID=A0A1M5K3C8_9FLAO|nr:hypothetical protein SAMN05421866_0557 [Chryseobacterium oranimense]